MSSMTEIQSQKIHKNDFSFSYLDVALYEANVDCCVAQTSGYLDTNLKKNLYLFMALNCLISLCRCGKL